MRPLLRPALFALWSTALVAIVANLLVLFAGQAANGAPIFVEMQGMTLDVDPVTVILATIAGALMAAVGSLLAMRLLPPGRGPLVIIIAGSVLALLSLFGTTAALTATGVATLVVMHLATGTVVVVGNAVIHSRAKDRAAVSTR